MVISALILVGLCLGSFVNALVYRVHEQAHELHKKKPSKQYLTQLSVLKGRSMCPDCKHELAAKDLVPVLSWLSTKGKCRYCKKPISWQYPLVELVTAGLFVASYVYWPTTFTDSQQVVFGVWLLLLTGLMALLVYDIRWMLLPNRIMLPLYYLAALLAIVAAASSGHAANSLFNTVLAVLVGGGIFYVLFQVSNGKWIGGGDVKLGWLLGLVAGTPARSLLFIFLAALLGSLFSLPLLVSKRLQRTSLIPFGPFLIISLFVVYLFGHSILHWYRQTFVGY